MLYLVQLHLYSTINKPAGRSRYSKERVYNGREGIPDEITKLINKNKMEAAIAWFNQRHPLAKQDTADKDDRASSCWGDMICGLIPYRRKSTGEYIVSDETIGELLKTIRNFNSCE